MKPSWLNIWGEWLYVHADKGTQYYRLKFPCWITLIFVTTVWNTGETGDIFILSSKVFEFLNYFASCSDLQPSWGQFLLSQYCHIPPHSFLCKTPGEREREREKGIFDSQTLFLHNFIHAHFTCWGKNVTKISSCRVCLPKFQEFFE